jgi:hypothetical protein
MPITRSAGIFANGTSRLQPVKVTILHEDLPTALCAKALFDCVLPELDGADLEIDYWRFDALCDAELRTESVGASQSSAIIVFSIRDRKGLPLEVKEWIAQWVSVRGDHPCAFVALLGARQSESAERHPILKQLQRAAERAGADFFCEYCEPPFLNPTPTSSRTTSFRVADLAWTPRNGLAEHKPTDCWRTNA